MTGYDSLLTSMVFAFWLNAGCCVWKFMEVLDNVAFHQRVKRLLHREIGVEAGTSPTPVPGLCLSQFAAVPWMRPGVLTSTPHPKLILDLSVRTNYSKFHPAFQRFLIFSLLFHDALEFCTFLEGKSAVCLRPPRSAIWSLQPHECQCFWLSDS